MLHGLPALTDHELYATGDPHAVWDVLREECRVYSARRARQSPAFWAVTAYSPGLEVLTQWDRFSAVQGIFLRPDPGEPYPGAGTMLALSDPPRHDVLRRAIAGLFSRRAIEAFEAHAEQVVGSWSRKPSNGRHSTLSLISPPRYRLRWQVSCSQWIHIPIPMIASATHVVEEKSTDINGLEAQEAHLNSCSITRKSSMTVGSVHVLTSCQL